MVWNRRALSKRLWGLGKANNYRIVNLPITMNRNIISAWKPHTNRTNGTMAYELKIKLIDTVSPNYYSLTILLKAYNEKSWYIRV